MKQVNLSGDMTKVTIFAVGDIMLGDQALRLGNGAGSVVRRKGPDYIFDWVRPMLSRHECVFGNLETVLSGRGYDPRELSSSAMRGAPESAAALKRAGFNTLSVANNHIFDHGVEAFQDTVRNLSSAGIRPVGLSSNSGKCEPLAFDCGRKRIGFLGYSWFPRRRGGAGLSAVQRQLEDNILADIGSVAGKVDILALSLHWGYEYMDGPSPAQIRFAHKAVGAGVKIVLGHHPHCLQGIEEYRGGLICYSLGNFVFDFWQRRLRSSLILKVEADNAGAVQFSTIPIRINRYCQPVPLESESARKILGERISVLSNLLPRFLSMSDEQYLALVESRRRKWRYSHRFHFLMNLWRFRPEFWLPALKLYRTTKVYK